MCSGAESEQANCCLHGFPLSWEETNLSTAMAGRADYPIIFGRQEDEGPGNGAVQASNSAAEDLPVLEMT